MARRTSVTRKTKDGKVTFLDRDGPDEGKWVGEKKLYPTKTPRVYEKIVRVIVRECRDCPNFYGGAPWYEVQYCDATEMHRNPAKDMEKELIPFWCPLPLSTGQKSESSENWKKVPIQPNYKKKRR